MKSAEGTSKPNYRTAYIAVSNEVSDRLQLDGELGKINDWGCTCSYKAGSLGNLVLLKSIYLIIFFILNSLKVF